VPTQAKLTPEVQDQICAAIRAGNYMETAAVYAGIGNSTFKDWMRKGRAAPRGGYHDFVLAVEKALADSEVRDMALIGRAGETQWQAAAWRLERRYPDRFGRRTRVDHATQDGKPFPVSHSIDPSKLTDDQLEALKLLLEQAQPDSQT
jgi:hypothetical protein